MNEKYYYALGWLTGVVQCEEGGRKRVREATEKIVRLSETTGSRSQLQKLILGVLFEYSDMCNAHLATLAGNLANGLKRIEER